MTSLRTTIMSWKTIATKISSSIGWIGLWRKPCINFILCLRRRNEMVYLRKNYPWHKMKILSAGQIRNRRWANLPRYGKELKASP